MRRLRSGLKGLLALTAVSVYAGFIGVPEGSALELLPQLASNGNLQLKLIIPEHLSPRCITLLEFSVTPNFSGSSLAVGRFAIGSANYHSGTISLKLSSLPADWVNGVWVKKNTLYSRLVADCSDTETPAVVSSKTEEIDLRVATSKKLEDVRPFLSALVGKSLDSAIRKARKQFVSSLETTNISKQAPVITKDLTDKGFSWNEDIVLRVEVGGSNPLKYDWFWYEHVDPAHYNPFRIFPYSGKLESKAGIEIVNDALGSTLIVHAKARLVTTGQFSGQFIYVTSSNKFGKVRSSSALLNMSGGYGTWSRPTPVPTVTAN